MPDLIAPRKRRVSGKTKRGQRREEGNPRARAGPRKGTADITDGDAPACRPALPKHASEPPDRLGPARRARAAPIGACRC